MNFPRYRTGICSFHPSKSESRDGAKFFAASLSLDYQTEELNRLSLRSYVNIICAKLVSLNRPMKLAILDDDTVVPYDHLLLCTGNQFHAIAPMQATVINPLSRKPAPPRPDRMLFGRGILVVGEELLFDMLFSYLEPAPPNVLTINDEFEAAMALKWLRLNHHNERKEKNPKNKESFFVPFIQIPF